MCVCVRQVTPAYLSLCDLRHVQIVLALALGAVPVTEGTEGGGVNDPAGYILIPLCFLRGLFWRGGGGQ